MTHKQPWHEVTKDLVDVAMGRQPATLVIKNGRWVNVHSGEIIPNTDVAIWQSRIAYVGENADHTIGEETKVVEANGRYLIPHVSHSRELERLLEPVRSSSRQFCAQ